MWDNICQGEGDVAPKEPKIDKELAIWKNKDKKAYALIVTTISE